MLKDFKYFDYLCFRMQTIKMILEYVTFAIGIATALVGVVKYILLPLWSFLKRLYKLIETISLYTRSLDELIKEFKISGGLKDLKESLQNIEYKVTSSDYKIKALFAANDIAAIETDKNGKCTWASKKWCELTGLLPSETLGNGWILGIHEDERSDIFEEWKKSIENNVDFLSSFRIGNNNLGYRKIQARSTIIESDSNVIGHLITIETFTRCLPTCSFSKEHDSN